MSSIRHSLSFITTTKKNLESQNLLHHNFLFSAKDLAALHTSEKTFGLLAEMGGVQGLCGALRTDIQSGLFADEVATNTYESRKLIYGSNLYPIKPMKSFFVYCWEALVEPIMILLIVAGAVSIGIGALEDNYTEGVAILIAVALVTLAGAGNNWKMERSFRQKDADKEKEKCSVIRNDKLVEIDQDDLTVGDLVSLSAGNRIPADGILVSLTPVKVDESSVTGEADHVPKDFYRPILRGGSELVEGECIMLTTSVGFNSSWGRIMKTLDTAQQDTPLQVKLEGTAKTVGYIGGSVAFLLFAFLAIKKGVQMVDKDQKFSDEGHHFLEYLILSFTIIVVAIPEGLPLAVIVSLSYSRKKMLDDNNLVRILSACETMGNATAICTDKTGTLTTNKMTVVKFFLADTWFDVRPTVTQISEQLRNLLTQGVVVNSKTFIEQSDPKKTQGEPETWNWQEGNATEKALISWLVRYNINIKDARNQYPTVISYPFDSVKKRSSVILKHGTGFRRYFKGAAESILSQCSTFVNKDNGVQAMETTDRNRVENVLKSMTSTGLRTIAFGYFDYPVLKEDENGDFMDPGDNDNNELTFFGTVGIKDPPRPGVPESVDLCQRAGVVVRMVTGDHLDTAIFIAKEVGILTGPNHTAMEGKDFRRLIKAGLEEELVKTIPNLRVLARSLPEDKELLVKWLMAHGEVVAVTGDGTNDAPALKAAHVGLAMAIAGTQVARNAAQINIMDDNFTSIVKSVMWGRSVFDNIRKFVQFQLTVNVVALSLSLIGAISGVEKPLNAIQLLWVNLIMDTMAALALGTERPKPDLLNRKPYSPNANLISPLMWRNILAQSVFQLMILCIVMYIPQYVFPDAEYKSVHHKTVIFNTFVWLQVTNEINSRKVNEEFNVFDQYFANFTFTAVILFTAVLQWVLIQYGSSFVGVEPISAREWGIGIGLGLASLPFGLLFRCMMCFDAESGRIKVPVEAFEGAEWKKYSFCGKFYDEQDPTTHRPKKVTEMNQLNEMTALVNDGTV